ncbi:Hypoxanthine-guanine phosphoribosyltransferase [Pedobacter sp. Bi27]|uniref:hypoxanthine phosphoribosyltransferase n=1 Tax=unclassified Pedobacter TaxID=2628915 RepID=UPI001DE82767|nr:MULTISPECIES: hypoxanthine phosphoribosyltransferase [unclassified Pedobacter]CAH0187544.1 Hypoxanthine-guanine phosphoribosyltransferase [Pedobacter sp. Bi36]CAH0211146.1 Hypoxanthine-guanine phosphoribosyltransferase [Pedobacter sp. Bi27]CAH0243302.1 Hypoxanthine-guanine phosphoribosyltransferase [Pedobacter sp. Bi126]
MHKIKVEDKAFEIFLENDTLNKRIRLLGIQINVDYEGKCPLFIGVLNGSFLFMADLIKEINVPCEVAFMRVASYEGTASSGNVKELIGLPDNIEGRDIIIVEDIVDTGLTLTHILKTIKEKKPASIKVASLLLKPSALKYEIEELEYVGFEIPNEFVVGYGLDYNGLGRNLTDIYRATEA